MNRLYPFTLELHALADSPESQAETVNKVLSNKFIQSFLTIASDPKVPLNINSIMKNPSRTDMAYVEGGWLLLFLVLRAALIANIPSKRWLIHLVIKLLAGIIFIAVSSIAIPWYFLGKPYFELLVIFSNFFKML